MLDKLKKEQTELVIKRSVLKDQQEMVDKRLEMVTFAIKMVEEDHVLTDKEMVS